MLLEMSWPITRVRKHRNPPLPGEPDPLSPGRTDVNPDDEPGIDELPDNDGTRPDHADEPDQSKVPDIDPDNAEMDDQLNPLYRGRQRE